MRTPREEAHSHLALSMACDLGRADRAHGRVCDIVTGLIENARAEGYLGKWRGGRVPRQLIPYLADDEELAFLGISRELIERKLAETLE